MGRPFEELLDRILPRIDIKGEDDCWNWGGICNTNGYPIMQIGSRNKRKTCRVHRILYQELIGLVKENELILHECDNKKCLNPRHLESGNYQKNNQDAWDRGLKRRGFIPSGIELKRLYTKLGSQRALAFYYSVSQPWVCYWLKEREVKKEVT